jgi:hypothetical protein
MDADFDRKGLQMTITTYTSLGSAVSEWMARAGDTDIATRFDDLLALQEQRMYYGAKEVPGILPAFEPLRIREMENTDTAFALTATVAQPTGFLELISAYLNNYGPLEISSQSTIDSYANQTAATPLIIAPSGTNFRVWPDPGTGSYTATLRYYKKLTSPSATNATNWILTNAPGVYLNGCLLQAALYTGDMEAAKTYGALYVAEVGGLNERRNGELRGAHNVKIRVRGRTP